MGADKDQVENVDDGSLGGTPPSEDVKTRAEGRPPEEESSDDPTAQAEAILQESEERIEEGADGSETPAE